MAGVLCSAVRFHSCTGAMPDSKHLQIQMALKGLRIVFVFCNFREGLLFGLNGMFQSASG